MTQYDEGGNRGAPCARTTRLFEIIQLLRSARKPLTAAEIATLMEVAPRTIYRDIASLQATSVPILGEAGIGYVMRPGYDLPPLMLSVEEVEAVTIALCLLSRTGDKGFKAAAQSIQGKIAAVLPQAARSSLDHHSLRASGWGAAEPEGVDLGLVRAAIRDERKLEVFYEDNQGCQTTRILQPIAVIYYVEVINIVAWCQLRSGFRHFRADRIKACAALDQYFRGQGEPMRKAWAAERDAAQAFGSQTMTAPVQSGGPLLSPGHDHA